MAKKTRNKHIGSDFDTFLRDESLLADAQATAIKRVLALQIESAMRAQGISKATSPNVCAPAAHNSTVCSIRAMTR